MPSSNMLQGVLSVASMMRVRTRCLSAMASAPTPILPLGGEWAGWTCAFNGKSGALVRVQERYCSSTMIEWGQQPAGFETCVTETWREDTNSIERALVRILPEDGCALEAGCQVESTQSAVPVPRAGAIELRQPLSLLMLEPKCWALDEAVCDADDADMAECDASDEAAALWECESVFSGVGGPRPRERRGAADCPAERTRISLTFDAATGRCVNGVSVAVERCWSARPSAELESKRTTSGAAGRSGLDAGWVSSLVGLDCFGEQPAAALAADDSEGSRLDLPGGVRIRGRRGLLEVEVDGLRRMRRTWVGGSCFVEVDEAPAPAAER